MAALGSKAVAEYSFVQGFFTMSGAAARGRGTRLHRAHAHSEPAIPLVLEGRDLLAAAQTGTGKTAAFALPLLQRLQAHPADAARPARVLVLVPTRELAAQVSDSFRVLARHLPVRGALIFGGVSPKPQIQALSAGVDLVIATPGRLLDHLQARVIDLSHIEVLVLDEADRMLDMGFIRAIRRIIAALAQAAAKPDVFGHAFPRRSARSRAPGWSIPRSSMCHRAMRRRSWSTIACITSIRPASIRCWPA
jgi:hypothetical protein